MIELTENQKAQFATDGFTIVSGVLDAETIGAARAKFPLLFGGEFETGLQPDEWNWRSGRDPEELTRQICNGWKADRTVAGIVLREDIGRACAQLRGWPGARINQDNVIWKPLLFGSLIVAVLLSVTGYCCMRLYWRWHVLKRFRNRNGARPGNGGGVS